jgi:hypothetical protein
MGSKPNRPGFLLAAATAAAAVAFIPAPANADEPTEVSCSVISREDNGVPKTTPVDKLEVIEQTSKEGAFTLPRGVPKDVQAVICKRSSVMPAANDYKVLQAGYTLYVIDGLGRVSALGLVDSEVKLNMLDGAMTEAEQSQASARLAELQARMQ